MGLQCPSQNDDLHAEETADSNRIQTGDGVYQEEGFGPIFPNSAIFPLPNPLHPKPEHTFP